MVKSAKRSVRKKCAGKAVQANSWIKRVCAHSKKHKVSLKDAMIALKKGKKSAKKSAKRKSSKKSAKRKSAKKH